MAINNDIYIINKPIRDRPLEARARQGPGYKRSFIANGKTPRKLAREATEMWNCGGATAVGVRQLLAQTRDQG